MTANCPGLGRDAILAMAPPSSNSIAPLLEFLLAARGGSVVTGIIGTCRTAGASSGISTSATVTSGLRVSRRQVTQLLRAKFCSSVYSRRPPLPVKTSNRRTGSSSLVLSISSEIDICLSPRSG